MPQTGPNALLPEFHVFCCIRKLYKEFLLQVVCRRKEFQEAPSVFRYIHYLDQQHLSELVAGNCRTSGHIQDLVSGRISRI